MKNKKPYIVSMHEEIGDSFVSCFKCMAEDYQDAYDQAEIAFPYAELLLATPQE